MAILAAALAVLAALPAAAAERSLRPEEMLLRYVNAPDPAYHWERGPETRGPVTVCDIILTSQHWKQSDWQHMLRVFRPQTVAHPGWMGLYITGEGGAPEPGKPRGEDAMGRALAEQMQAPVAMLYQVPNQPLFGNLDEGTVLDYSFQQYIKEGDPTWPVLFPMAKSGVRAMDALQEYTRRYWGQRTSNFVVMGGSKRGWATWLVAAADRTGRVKAIAPIVFDMLDIPGQFQHALDLWGRYGEVIQAFTSRGMGLTTPRGRALWASVDPYTWRRQLGLPKLIVNATNDPTYVSGALNVYWDGLRGPKWVYYAPNSGHGMETGLERTLSTLAGFFRAVASGHGMPAMSWQRKSTGTAATITIKAPAAKVAVAWVAVADKPDFRRSQWESRPMEGKRGHFTLTIPRPADKDMMVFGQAEFEVEGRPCYLCTQPLIVRKSASVSPAPAPPAPPRAGPRSAGSTD